MGTQLPLPQRGTAPNFRPYLLRPKGCMDQGVTSYGDRIVESGGPQKAHCIRQVAPMCHHGRAYWRHLANTSEPSDCGGDDAALCQISLITFYSARNARIASAVLATAIPSVRLSHAGIASKQRHVARCSLDRWIAKCV